MKIQSIRAVLVVGVLVGAAVGCDGKKDEAGEAHKPPALSQLSPNGAKPPVVVPVTVTPPTADEALLAKAAVNGFAFDLWQKASATTGGNFVVAPASVWTALAMTEMGAGKETDAELRKALHIEPMKDGGGISPLHGIWGKVLGTWNAPSDAYVVRAVNRLFGEKSYRFEPAYLAHMTSEYRALMERVDFRADAAAATKTINDWVGEKTEGRIPKLIPDGVLDDQTRLVLTNAIYFLGKWSSPFEKSRTSDGAFAGVTKQTTVPTMHKIEHLNYADVDGVQVIDLPYQGDAFAMTVILPKSKTGLDAVSKGLDAATYAKWLAAMKFERVDLAMPKVDLNPAESLALKPVLEALGIHTAFDRINADFTGIAKPPVPEDRLFISEVFHKAVVRIDEEGTEAAAATAVIMARAGAGLDPNKPIAFKADHPFLFTLRDTRTGVVLFVGRVMDVEAVAAK